MSKSRGPVVAWIGAAPGTHSARLPDYAAKADMAGRGVDWLGETRRRPVSPAVIRSAKMRAALEHFAWDLVVRLTRIEARIRSPGGCITGRAA